MSIFDETSRPRPVGVRLFVDRCGPCRDFAARINAEATPQEILVYVGVGGNGKTALLRTFKDRCSFRLPPDQWREIESYSDEIFVDSLGQAPGATPVPVAMLDFGMQPQGANRPQEPLSALFILKRQLAEHGVATPRFDFAAITYLQRSGADVRVLTEEMFPPSELQAAGRLIDALVELPIVRIGSALYDWVNNRLDSLMAQRRLLHRAPHEVVEEVLALSPEPELMEILPRLFADDLRAALTAARRKIDRIVLLFDTYEAVAGEWDRGGFSGLGGPRWIRSLLGHLPLADGVVPVVAGRSVPRWSEALVDPIPDHYVRLNTVGPLPEYFAQLYMSEAGLTDRRLQDALIAYSEAEPGLVHPLLLGLSTDVALISASRAAPLRPGDLRTSAELRARERVLVARLLQRVGPELQDAVAAVSAARSFDYEIFTRLGTRLGFPVTTLNFHRLTGLSFVTPQAGGRRFAIHQLLRRAVAAVAEGVVREAHEILADYYVAVPQDEQFLAKLEHIYHRAVLDPVEGVEFWLREMDRVLAISRFDLCRSLLNLLNDLEVPEGEAAEACASRVVRADIAFGQWSVAEERLAALPQEAANTLLLRANLAFVHGDFALAESFASRALDVAPAGPDRLPFLLMSAELMLFLGRFEDGRSLCIEGLAIAGTAEDPNEVVRWHIKYASIEFFAGRIDEAKNQLVAARERLQTIPEDQRDRNAEAGLCVEEAVVAEAESRPVDARHGQAEALRIRREIGDIRGEAHALNGVGLAELQLGDAAMAEARFLESAAIARDLGEELLYAKVTRGRAEAATLASRFDDADRLASEALAGFEQAAIPYDIAHGWITQARVNRARGDEKSWLDLVDQARREIEAKNFGSLYTRCPETAVPDVDRISRALTAFAAGDALGVPWEGSPPDAVDAGAIASIPPTTWGWPRGATSDDTAQVLLVSRMLVDTAGEPTPGDFMARLAAVSDDIRGLGPTTKQAVEHFRETGLLPEPVPAGLPTNGAAMRILPVGWATPVADPALRRQRVHAVATATHHAPEAVAAACVIAAMGAWAVEGVGIDTILQAAADEVEWASQEYADLAPVRAALAGTWTPPPTGVDLDAAETTATVVHVLRHTPDLAEALPYAVSLGGDTDTVAAMVGGILGARAPEQVEQLEWLDRVDFEPRPDLAEGIRELRRSWYAAA